MDYRRASLASTLQHRSGSQAPIYSSFAGGGPSRQSNGNIYDMPATMWWDEERIHATVNRQFILSKLRPDEQARLDEPLGFGDGLTDDTYIDRIEQKVKRIFLILVDLGVPDQIFGVIDDSWDDDDLPVPLDHVERLKLTYDKDQKLERRFFQRQFIYLLRNIQKGVHEYYDDEEVVPLELAENRPVAGLTHSNIDKVFLPGRPDEVFVRQRVPFGTTPGCMPQEEFLSGLDVLRNLGHHHIESLWASYIHQGSGYLLLRPVSDVSLKSFLNVTPQSVKILSKLDRRMLVLNWIHCLAEAVSFLHGQGHAHRAIMPSNILLDADNHIFLSDPSVFGAEKTGLDNDMYDYQAPEQPAQPPPDLTSSRHSIRRSAMTQSVSAIRQSTLASNDSSSVYASSGKSSAGGLAPGILPTAKHDPQKADIYSLGTIFLEIMTFLMKRSSRNFASHRSSKNKTTGRAGGLPDSSFHKNPEQVESWMTILAKEGKKKEDKVFRCVSHVLALTDKMLNPDPEKRPSAHEVEEKVYFILVKHAGLGPTSASRGLLHCVRREAKGNEWIFGIDQLRLASQRAAAEACASVNVKPVTANGGMIGLTGAVAYSLQRANSVVPSAPAPPVRERTQPKEVDLVSVSSGRKSRSSEGKSRSGSGSLGSGKSSGKPKPKAKAWQAPVYAGSWPFHPLFSLFPYNLPASDSSEYSVR